MKYLLAAFSVFILFIFTITPSYAASSYVLPYPGIMPGNKLYKAHVLLEGLQKYFAFGNLAQFKYNLSESDKYLIEAKTLFEYNQYPLAVSALRKSTQYFEKVYPSLLKAKKQGENIAEKKLQFESAQVKHLEVLRDLQASVPEEFVWEDEKKSPVALYIKQDIMDAIKSRSK